MSSIIYVAGTPGAGKSSVLKLVEDTYKVVNVGTEMLEIGKKQGIVKDKDDIRYMNPHKQQELRLETMKQIEKMPGKVLVDSHASVRNTTRRYVVGLTNDEVKVLKDVKALIYVDATPDEILARRMKDSTRKRNEDTKENIMEQHDLNVALMGTYAVMFNAPLYFVRNHDGKLEDAAKRIKQIAKEVLGE